MKVTKIYYKRLYSLSDYQNKEVGIEVECENDSPETALNFAIDFVEQQNPQIIKESEEKKAHEELAKYEKIIASAGNYSESEVIEAAKIIRKIKYEELPF